MALHTVSRYHSHEKRREISFAQSRIKTGTTSQQHACTHVHKSGESELPLLHLHSPAIRTIGHPFRKIKLCHRDETPATSGSQSATACDVQQCSTDNHMRSIASCVCSMFLYRYEVLQLHHVAKLAVPALLIVCLSVRSCRHSDASSVYLIGL